MKAGYDASFMPSMLVVLLILFAASGCAALIYEIVLTAFLMFVIMAVATDTRT